MANDKSYTEMLRDAYKPELIEELQDAVQSYTPFVTHIPVSGKQVEMNTIGKVEVGFRVDKADLIVDQDIAFGRRSMRPVSLALAIPYYEDDMIMKGDFAAGPSDFVKQMSNAFNRGIDSVVLGTMMRKMKVQSGDAGRNFYTVAPSTLLSAPASFYNGAAIGGICGTNYVGEGFTTAETLPVHATLADGELYTPAYEHEHTVTALDLDMVNTGVIPAGYKPTGSFLDCGMTYEKVIAVREAFEARDACQTGEIINMAITPQMKFQLLRDERLWNGQTGYQQLRNGFYSEILGVRFLVTSKVPIVNVGTSESPVWQYACPVWKTDEVIMGMWEDVGFRINKLEETHWGKWRIAAKCALGAARRRKETVMYVMVHAGLPAFDETLSTYVSPTVARSESA